MAAFVSASTMLLTGTAWTGTGPGPGNPTVSGTITSTTDWSTKTRGISFAPSAAMQDITTMGDALFLSQLPGLMNVQFTVDFNQDFSSSVDATIGPAFFARTLLYVDLKPTSSARGATNPSYVAACYVANYTPIGWAVGDRAGAPVTFAVSGTFARLTA